jgi:hypothetical protein
MVLTGLKDLRDLRDRKGLQETMVLMELTD